MRRKIFVTIAILAVISISTSAFADMVSVGNLSAMWGADGTGNSQMSTSEILDNEDGTFTLEEMWNIANNCMIDFDMTYDPDPYITSGLAVTNNAAFTQTFTFTFTAPVSPAITPSTLYGGSMSGSLTGDLSNGGTLSTAPGSPLYMGMIDAAGVLPIYADPSSWNVGALGSANISAVNYPTTLTGPAAMSTISTVYTFTLTPGEMATMNGFFEVVPEPATMAMLGFGALLIRRKK